ncbi:glycosyltransferase [Cerasicoccus maritimus]|uniref:glycosyltransferase n=1 Tax=Cerasicoccus maritimus TaxID=490089 RepID=UPI002852ABC2|nr:glycosyltransferase [Cerasicoccus maritimus]
MPKQRKVLFALPSMAFGGAERMAICLITQLVERGHRLQLTSPVHADNPSLNAELHGCKIPIHAWPSTPGQKLRDLGQLSLNVFKWLRLLRQVDVDIIHVNTPWPNLALDLLIAAAMLKLPVLMLHQLVPPDQAYSQQTQKLYHWMHERGLQLAAVSNSNAEVLAHSLRLDTEQIQVIENAAVSQAESQSDAQAIQTFTHNHHIPPNSIIVLCIGRISDQKGYDLVAPAAYHITRINPKVHFVWVGDGPDRSKLETQLENYKLKERFTITGWLSEPLPALQSADLLLFPSRYEGLPISIIEAMQIGLPIVAADCNGVSDLLSAGHNARLFRSQDTCDLMENLRSAIADPNSMRALAKQAQIDAEQYSLSRMADQAEQFYERMLNER